MQYQLNIKLLKYDCSRKLQYFHLHLHEYFDIHNKYIKKLNNYISNKELKKDVFWKSYVRWIYTLCQGGNFMAK